MKIAFILYDYYPFGGLQDDCLKTALQTAELGHETHIFTRTWKGEQPANLKIHLLGKHGWTNTSRNEHFFRQVNSELLAQNFDGVVAFNRVPEVDIYYAADPCYAARSSNWSFIKKLSPRHRYYLNLEKRVFETSKPPQTLVLTDKEIGAFQSYYPVETSSFHVLPPGVAQVNHQADVAAENRKVIREELGCSPEATVALFVGSGFRIKGLDRALKAIAANQATTKELEFWIVGNDKAERYAKLIKEAQVPIRILGGRADVDRFYQAADFLLHPAYSESAGKVLLEALTHGLPVLTADTCGYGFHIEKANAGVELKSPYSQAALNKEVKRFILEEDSRKTWSKSALSYAANEDLYSCHQTAAVAIERLLKKG